MSEPLDTPDCPKCDARETLEPYGKPDTFGSQWHVCTCCSITCLVHIDGRILLVRAAK